jgi:putative oxidoreductase
MGDSVRAFAILAAEPMARLTILIEMLGGIAILIGAFITLLSVPMIAVLLLRCSRVNLPFGFSSVRLIGMSDAGRSSGRRAKRSISCTSHAC